MAHLLVVDLALELPAASAITGLLLATALIVQFSLRRYRPLAYWMVVVVTGVVATLLHAIVVDELGIAPWAAATAFSVGLAAILAAWFFTERTLSIHTIVTRRREAYYWLAILLALTLGASIGASALVLGGSIALVAIGYRLGVSPLVAFWASYVVIRPLGASFGTYLAASPSRGGLGLGSTATSLLFLAVILLIVAWFGLREHRARAAWKHARGRHASSTISTGFLN